MVRLLLDRFVSIVYYKTTEVLCLHRLKGEQKLRAEVSDISIKHGLVFTLNLSDTFPYSGEVDFLKRRLLKPLISGQGRNQSTLYVNRIEFTDGGLKLVFVEQPKVEVYVAAHFNDDRIIE